MTGLYILSKIKSVFENQNNVRLYRDDGLGVLQNLSSPQTERAMKNHKNFQRMWIINNNKNKPQGCTISRHRTRSYK